MKIDMFEDYELTNDFFNNHSIDDVLWFSYAEAGAMGIPGNIEAVVKSNDQEIDIYSNSYVMQKEVLSAENVMKFFTPLSDRTELKKWTCLNLGVGNCLFVRNEYSKEFLNKYELLQEFPYIIYETWRKFSDYYLNIIFNGIDDKEKLKDLNDHISVICDQFSFYPENKNEDLKKVLSKDDISYLNISGIDIDVLDLDEIIDKLEDEIQFIDSDNENLNKVGIRCEEILNKIRNLGSSNEKIYTYVSVVYNDDIVATTIKEPSFYYKTDLKDIAIGNKVLVDRAGKTIDGEVVDIEYFNEDDVPFPVEKTKDIIKILEYGMIDVYQSESNKYVPMEVIGKYKYIGGLENENLKEGKIYNRIGNENEFRIVDDSKEDYLYQKKYFEKI